MKGNFRHLVSVKEIEYMKDLLILTLLFTFLNTSAQSDNIFSRLQAINNNGVTFYNIDGYSIVKQTLNYPFTKKGLKKVFRKYSIKPRPLPAIK